MSTSPNGRNNDLEGKDANDRPSKSGLDRLEHFTWGWYTLPMATGGLALLLSPAVQPHTFPGLNTIGKVVYIIDLVLFTLITIAITYRFLRFHGTFTASLTHPTESLLSPTILLSLASIIAAIARYGIPSCGPWLITVYRTLFWIYFSITFLTAVGQYTLLFTSPALKIEDMTPAWDLPIFPFMLSGTIAATGAQYQPPDQAIPMIVAGLTAQGLGFLVSILMYASYIRRMIQFGFPGPDARPAMFIAVGPPAFTSLALLGMANAWPKTNNYNFFATSPPIPSTTTAPLTTAQQLQITTQIMHVLSGTTAIFIWSLSFWFFCIALSATLLSARQHTLKFHLNWWSFVFPNVGLTIATINIGKLLQSEGVMWVGSVMTVCLVGTYFFVLVMNGRAVWRGEILGEGRDEDVYSFVGLSKSPRAVVGNGDVEKRD